MAEGESNQESRERPATGTEAAVCRDIAERQRLGVRKYGTTVAANPADLRAWLRHAYEEALDQAVYLKRAMEEMDGQEPEQKEPKPPIRIPDGMVLSTNDKYPPRR